MSNDRPDDEDTGMCGICGIDPVEYIVIPIGLTIVSLCKECYETIPKGPPEDNDD